jgi:iron uptake system component EfeO
MRTLAAPCPRHRALATLAALPMALSVGLAGCSNDAAPVSADPVRVTASDTACQVSRTRLVTGVNTLKITNTGSKVTELYVYTAQGKVVAERENIGPGLDADVTFEVDAGEYQVACKPGQSGAGIRQKITVSAPASGATPAGGQDPRLTAAVTAYRAYVQRQADEGLPVVQKFARAVSAGDLKTAAATYAPSRQAWERIEPVAESFGDLDPALDLREADLEPGQEWTGWHRLEKAVFRTRSLTGQGEYAQRLVRDYRTLQGKVTTAEITPTSMANGAKELLDEVATGKITGEEDVWSGTDLWDFAANVEGARKVYDLLREAAGGNDPALRAQLDAGFTAVSGSLGKYRRGAGYVDYRTVPEDERKILATAVDTLAEPLSRLAAAATRTPA